MSGTFVEDVERDLAEGGRKGQEASELILEGDNWKSRGDMLCRENEALSWLWQYFGRTQYYEKKAIIVALLFPFWRETDPPAHLQGKVSLLTFC